MERNKEVHVVPSGDDWIVKIENSDEVLHTDPNQDEAIEAGRRIARANRTELVIHGKDGRIREKDSYGNDPYPPGG